LRINDRSPRRNLGTDHEKRHPELAKDVAWAFEARCFAALNMTVTRVLMPDRRCATL
jgi:hypothetical protein